MEKKKSIYAILFIALFTFSSVANSFEDILNEQSITKIEKKKIEVPTNG